MLKYCLLLIILLTVGADLVPVVGAGLQAGLGRGRAGDVLPPFVFAAGSGLSVEDLVAAAARGLFPADRDPPVAAFQRDAHLRLDRNLHALGILAVE